jgi:hypothetical protein
MGLLMVYVRVECSAAQMADLKVSPMEHKLEAMKANSLFALMAPLKVARKAVH